MEMPGHLRCELTVGVGGGEGAVKEGMGAKTVRGGGGGVLICPFGSFRSQCSS